MNDDTDFNKILEKQKIIAPSTNLSARIIAAANREENIPLWAIIMREFTTMFIIPRPAYAVALTLVFGLILGLQAEAEQFALSQDWLSFMDVSAYSTEENWL